MAAAAVTLIDNRPIPFEAVRFHGLQDKLRCAGLLSWWVDILDTQQPAAIARTSFKETRNGGDKGAEM